MAQFSLCKKFYDQHSPGELRPVMQSYQRYLQDLKRSESKQKYSKIIKSLEANNDDNNSSITEIKKTFTSEYLEDYPEEKFQYNESDHENIHATTDSNHDDDSDDSLQL